MEANQFEVQNEKIYNEISKIAPETRFCGYEEDDCDAKLLYIVKDGKFVNSIKKFNK